MMAKNAVQFAIKHQIRLMNDGKNYFIVNPITRKTVEASNRNTGQSAIVMMKKFLRTPEHLRYWR